MLKSDSEADDGKQGSPRDCQLIYHRFYWGTTISFSPEGNLSSYRL